MTDATETPVQEKTTTEKRQPKIVKRLVKKQPWETMLTDNPALQKAISVLPSNYEFEVPKCLHKIKESNAKVVALQLPEGLLFCACILSDIFKNFGEVRVFLLSDVTYGACCIDDFTAEKLGCDLLIHYGHSCLVPIQNTRIKTIYVFVEIYFDTSHLIAMIRQHFPVTHRIALQGTVQFLRAVSEVATDLSKDYARVDVPQVKPLSKGETLGCTSAPLAHDLNTLIFIADGRFHMEATMIRNHHLRDCGNSAGETVHFYRYDPYSKVLSEEAYDTPAMVHTRKRTIDRVRLHQKDMRTFGVILGTLGRQGNLGIMERVIAVLNQAGKRVVRLLMAELAPWKLNVLAKHVDCFVQIACPRLSIDWAAREYEGQGGDGSSDNVLCGKPVLTPYELFVAMGHVSWQATEDQLVSQGGETQTQPDDTLRRRKYAYPMDYYSAENNPWNNYYKEPAVTAPTVSMKTSTNSSRGVPVENEVVVGDGV